MDLIAVIILCLLVDCALAEKTIDRTRLRVKKDGEFGQRVQDAELLSSSSSSFSTAVSQEIELPIRPFNLNKQESHNKRKHPKTNQHLLDRVSTVDPYNLEIRKPSLDLELPRFGGRQNLISDQEAQETEGSSGYVYGVPIGNPLENKNDEDGHPPPLPGTKTNNEYTDELTDNAPLPPVIPKCKNPAEPEVVSGNKHAVLPETDERTDGVGLTRTNVKPPSTPEIVGHSRGAMSDCSMSEDDAACWPHGYAGVISGESGKDYPVLAEIIQTDFSCDKHPFSGYYADTDPVARCQIFHICLKRSRHKKTQQWSFLCPNGTIFSQPDFVCVWWGDAPECNDDIVRSMYNLNEQLGWDNITDDQSGSGVGNGELVGAMSAFTSKKTIAPSTRSPSLAFRRPVKVVDESSGLARTKLQEVTQNTLYGQDTSVDDREHDGEKTILRKQTEFWSQPKTNHNLHKSASEDYNVQASPNDVQPLIVNRPPTPSKDESQHESPQLVMMPTLQRFPDGSEGFAQIPVMLPIASHNDNARSTPDPPNVDLPVRREEGYQYHIPTSTPPPTYLPPSESTGSPPTTTEFFTSSQVSTEPTISVDHGEYELQVPDRITSTKLTEGYRYSHRSSTESQLTEEQFGYHYSNPTLSDREQDVHYETEEDYSYPQSTTTERQTDMQKEIDDHGYHYLEPGTTPTSSSFRQTNPPTTAKVSVITSTDKQGYRYKAPTRNLQFEDIQETTTEPDNSYTYERSNGNPNEVYNDATKEQSTGVTNEDMTTVNPLPPTTTEVEIPASAYLPPRNSELLRNEDSSTDEIDYEDEDGENELVTQSSEGHPEDEDDTSNYSNHNLPTPSSPFVSEKDVGFNDILGSDRKLNEILKQVQNGGIEAVDSSGRPIEFSRLKELLLNSPTGSVELKGELDSLTSASTEVSTTPLQETTSNSHNKDNVLSHELNHKKITGYPIYGNGNSSISRLNFLPNVINNNNTINIQSVVYPDEHKHYNDDIVQFVDKPSYDIKLPSKEFESHFHFNAIPNDYISRHQSNQHPQGTYYQQQLVLTPQKQFFQTQQTPPESYLPPNQPIARQPRPDSARTNTVNNLEFSLPATQKLQQPPIAPSLSNDQYLPPRQATTSILQPKFYGAASPVGSFQTVRTEKTKVEQRYVLPIDDQQPSLSPRDINIVPAVFVHQHTSVAAQGRNRQNEKRDSVLEHIDDTFQNLDTAQSSYYSSSATTSLAYQLKQLANSTPVHTSNISAPRQFFRRSSKANENLSPVNASTSPRIEQAHQVTSFTLEDARTPEELQKYHHQDLKRFHIENIAKKGRVLDEVVANPPMTPTTPLVNISVVRHRQRDNTNRASTSEEGETRGIRFSGRVSSTGNLGDGGGVGGRASSNKDIPGAARNEDYFVPVSGSYGSSSKTGSDDKMVIDNASNNDDTNFSSQFRVNGGSRTNRNHNRRGRSGPGRESIRSFQFVDSESVLLRSFLPEKDGGFGSRVTT